MLTKDLLRFTRKQGRIYPQFIPIDHSEFLSIAEELRSFYNPDLKPSRSELADLTSNTINASLHIKIAAGFNKLILDRCKFTCAHDWNYPELRRQIFEKGTQILSHPQDLAYKTYRQKLSQSLDVPPEIFADLYADHPDNEVLMKVDLLSSQDLLNRYNLSLVQSLLLYAEDLKLEIVETNQGKLRQFFKYLKFFRLLAEISRSNDHSPKLKLVISGPASLFDNNRKYGLQLATFFPALCNLSQWKLETKIKLPGWDFATRLVLNQQSHPFLPIYHQFSAYIPEEIKAFHDVFRQKSTTWKIIGNAPFIRIPGGEVIFPDLSFQHEETGKIIHLELFHLWHAQAFERRLTWLEAHPQHLLLLGVERRVMSANSSLQQHLETSLYFQNKGFLFRDFPTVSRVISLLEQNLA